MGKWQRSLYQPVLPLGKDGKRVTGSAEHIALSRKAAGEGMVLVKNENDTLPLAKGTKVALFGKGTIDYVKGGGGSGDVTVEYIRNFYEYKAIPLHAKILSVSLIWITLLNCAIWIVNPIPLKVLLIALAVVISWHILSYKTLTKEQLEKNKRRTEQ